MEEHVGNGYANNIMKEIPERYGYCSKVTSKATSVDVLICIDCKYGMCARLVPVANQDRDVINKDIWSEVKISFAL